MDIQIFWKVIELFAICVILIPIIYFGNKFGELVFENRAIKIKYHTTGNKIAKIKFGDWIDLSSSEDVIINRGQFKLISLGISMKLPDGYEAHVVPRSSTFKTWGILQTNSMGVIDNSYSGNGDIWKFPAYATKDTEIKKGDRICQFRIMKKANMHFKEVEDLGDKNRGGFGSTGRSG